MGEAGSRGTEGAAGRQRRRTETRPRFPLPVRRVHELMNPNVVCARPGMTLREVARLLTRRRVSGAPVVDDRGRILGIVTQNDLTRALSRRIATGDAGRFYTSLDEYRDLGRLPASPATTPVEEVMRRRVYTVPRDAGVAIAAHIMRERRVHRLLVTERGLLVGIISALDLLAVVEEVLTAPIRSGGPA